ncbi:MAG: hypothetical protein ACK4Z7_02600 [Novosphingobium sp.]
MTPDIDERLASVVRALSEVILPHLPPEASLAQEQVHLCIGHLQIIRAQIDEAPAFERGELADALALAEALADGISGGRETTNALAALASARAEAATPGESPSAVRTARRNVHQAIEALVKAAACDADTPSRAFLSAEILRHESERSLKDRQWFAPFGFDTL